MSFDIINEISEVEIIATGSEIRELDRLKKIYGHGTWRKMKGVAYVRLPSGNVKLAELHWYESHGIGKKEIKRKKYLE
ncbi:MAG: hypothetical protein WC799_02705 [Desulfobacteraceae bacterium]|jgi:hypothetical protein